MSMYCPVCNGPLKVTDKKTICSDACRAKRSREKRTAQVKANDMTFQITQWQKLLSQGVITPQEARSLINTVWDAIYEFHKVAQEAQDVQNAKDAQEEAQKPRKGKRK